LAERGRHTKLTKAEWGTFARKEIVFLGLHCAQVQNKVDQIRKALPDFRIGYLDADHSKEEGSTILSISSVEGENVHTGLSNPLEINAFATHCDYLIINGNHHAGSRQVLFAQPEKKQSIYKRSKQLTNVIAIVADSEQSDSDSFFEGLDLGNYVSHKGDFSFDNWLLSDVQRLAPLKGILLAGGKSERMGADKIQLIYHQKPQWKTAIDLMESLKIATYVSCREDQIREFEENKIISDRMNGIGPMAAILSAFMSEPDSAWLVLAADMPDMDVLTLEKLISARKSNRIATAFQDILTHEPEPLAAIYEPGAYRELLLYLSHGNTCPRKFLKQAKANLIDLEDLKAFRNINTPAERDRWLAEQKK